MSDEQDERPDKKNESLVPKLPQKIEPRCHVCQSKHRDIIDRMAVMGYRAAHIARQVQDFAPEVSRKSIERHLTNHLSYEQEAMRQLLEDRAAEVGQLAEESKTKLITRMAVLDRMIEKGWEQLMKEDGWIKYQDVLKAIELKSTIETESGAQLQDQLTRQLSAIIHSVKELVDAEQWPLIARRAQELYDSPAIEMVVAVEPPPEPPKEIES